MSLIGFDPDPDLRIIVWSLLHVVSWIDGGYFDELFHPSIHFYHDDGKVNPIHSYILEIETI